MPQLHRGAGRMNPASGPRHIRAQIPCQAPFKPDAISTQQQVQENKSHIVEKYYRQKWQTSFAPFVKIERGKPGRGPGKPGLSPLPPKRINHLNRRLYEHIAQQVIIFEYFAKRPEPKSRPKACFLKTLHKKCQEGESVKQAATLQGSGQPTTNHCYTPIQP